ncbi:MAG: hypothetical protein B1H13_13900 [Desulfobacteraceae bacterium 4484_190.3]|nr:MAG: hypothetical protein B1H13_13900 [Desulfobacteraceae bacterium 4484_190.3]
MNKIYEQVEKIISPVYMVGGSVRDELMGIEPKDYDFITPHNPDTIEQKVRDAKRKPYLTGKRFGTIGVKVSGYMVEITTFRTERYQKGSRKPEVEFVNDIMTDLGRRDFTINAMVKRGNRLIDPFNGRGDIKKQIIKSVGNATTRFKEDPLRMLRAARFSAQLGFSIDQAVLKSATKLNYRILQVSRERWVAEMDRLLLSSYVDRGLNDLMEMGLFRYMIPELYLQKDYDQNSKYHACDLWKHTVRVTSSAPPDIDLRWAALLHDIAKPFVRIEKEDRSTYANHDILGREMVIRLGRYWRWSNKRIETVSELVKNHLRPDSPLRDADNTSKE